MKCCLLMCILPAGVTVQDIIFKCIQVLFWSVIEMEMLWNSHGRGDCLILNGGGDGYKQ